MSFARRLQRADGFDYKEVNLEVSDFLDAMPSDEIHPGQYSARRGGDPKVWFVLLQHVVGNRYCIGLIAACLNDSHVIDIDIDSAVWNCGVRNEHAYDIEIIDYSDGCGSARAVRKPP
jgi:hypothetical protein